MIAYITTSPSKTRVRAMVKVSDIAQTVASKDTNLEETVTIVDPNTHLKDALHMAKSVITAKRRDITPIVATPELVPSLHSASQERNYMT